MRYTEILNELSLPIYRTEVGQMLRQAGYITLGSGAYADVFGKPDKPYVLKVFDHEDDAYIDFVKLAKAHQNNPHFPKFYGNIFSLSDQKLKDVQDKLARYQAEFDKLSAQKQKLYYDENHEDWQKLIDKKHDLEYESRRNWSAIKVEKLQPYKYDPKLIVVYMKYRDFKYPDPNSYMAMEFDDALELFYDKPELKQACDLIIDNLLSKYKLDIREDNLMMRGNNIVFTDPVALKFLG